MKPASYSLTAEHAEMLTAGKWYGRPRDVVIRGAAVDSRQVRSGMLFVCIVGARVDGHDYAATAAGDGAALILAERPIESPIPVLVVENAERAFGQLAADFRQQFSAATWIGVAGANGKTTVKELIAASCAEQATHPRHRRK